MPTAAKGTVFLWNPFLLRVRRSMRKQARQVHEPSPRALAAEVIQISLSGLPSAFSILALTALARFSPLVRLSSLSGLSFQVLRQIP